MVDDLGLTQLFSGATFLLVAGWIVRTWPHWKAKVNEARKIELDASAGLRGDLLARIALLEGAAERSQSGFTASIEAERQRADAALSAERSRCDKELNQLRIDMANKYDGLLRQFVSFQKAVAEHAPPLLRTPEIDAMLESLNRVDAKKGKK